MKTVNDSGGNQGGVMYYVGGSGIHVDEAMRSAASVKRIAPGTPICLAHHNCGDKLDHLLESNLFDEAVEISGLKALPLHLNGINKHFLYRIEAFYRSPFNRTLYLDTDTRVAKPITELFTLLERYDFVVSPGPITQPGKGKDDPINNIPACFPEFNAGVILFRQNETVRRLLHHWYDCYRNNKKNLFRPHLEGGDQVSLRYLLWQSRDVKLGMFCHKRVPSLHNFRYPDKKRFCFSDDVVIHHGKHITKQGANEPHEPRVVASEVIFPKSFGVCRRIMETVRRRMNENTDWLNKEEWGRSLWRYGVPENVFSQVNGAFVDHVTYTDLLCLASLCLQSVNYLEVGVSTGKNFYALMGFLRFSSMTGLDIEVMSERLKNSLNKDHRLIVGEEKMPFIDWRGREHSLRLEKTDFGSDSQGNAVSYLRGDKLCEQTWLALKPNKFTLIFSDALHIPKSIHTEVDFWLKHELIGHELICIWDDVSQGQFSAVTSAANKLSRFFSAQSPVLLFITVGGTYGPMRRVGIFFSDRSLQFSGDK